MKALLRYSRQGFSTCAGVACSGLLEDQIVGINFGYGETPLFRLPEGLARMADWTQRIGPREPTVFDNIEALKNLPPGWLITPESR